MRRLLRTLVAATCLLATPALAAGAVSIVSVHASRGDSTLDCTVITSGVPDLPSRETLASGLPSSIVLSIVWLDATGRERSGSRSEIRVEPDPWEGTFVVRTPLERRRFTNIDEVGAWMRRLGPFRVAPLRGIDPIRPIRLRVRLTVHPLAPAEVERAHALFAGDMGAGGSDRREVSAGLGSLLRFFLGRAPRGGWQAQADSAPFAIRSLHGSPAPSESP